MNRVIIRLIIVVLALVLITVLYLGITANSARQRLTSAPTLVAPTEIVSTLAQQGKTVESITRRGTLYDVVLSDKAALTFDGLSGEQLTLAPSTGAAMATLHIVRKLQSQGYSEVVTPTWKKGFYHSTAISPSGAAVRLEIDPFSGNITKEIPR